MRILRFTPLQASALCLLCVFTVLPGLCAGFELTVAHLNDTHSYLEGSAATLTPGGGKTHARLGGWERLTTRVAALRAAHPHLALLHAGDAVQGDLYFMKYSGEPEMELLNRLRFDAFTLGNHEFDRGPEFLARMLSPLRVPVLAANMDASALPELAKQVRPYTVLEYDGETVGVIGLLTRHTDNLSNPGKTIRFEDEIRTARKYVEELTDLGVNKIILLTHVGYEKDKRLAAEVPGVDLIVGGHSHTLLGDETALDALGQHARGPYPTVIPGADGTPVYVVQAWKWGRVLPALTLTFDAAGVVTSARGSAPLMVADSFRRKNAEGEKVEVRGAARAALLRALAANPAAMVTPQDPATAAFLEPYTKGLQPMRKEVIGTASQPLPHVRVPTPALPEGSMLAPHVCASMLLRMEKTGQPADIALLNSGAVRGSLPEGNITVGDAYVLMPFTNTLHVLEVSGEQLKQALEHGLNQGGGAFPYIGGARYDADLSRPKGQRVFKVEVRTPEGGWAGLTPAGTYRLVLSSYLANGGDGYDLFEPLSSPETDTGFTDTQAFIDYVQETKVLAPPVCTGVKLVRN